MTQLNFPTAPDSETFPTAADAAESVSSIPVELATLDSLLCALGNFADDAHLFGVMRDADEARADLKSLIHRCEQMARTLEMRAAADEAAVKMAEVA